MNASESGSWLGAGRGIASTSQRGQRLATCLGIALVAVISGMAADVVSEAGWPMYTLAADRTWLVNLPQGKRLDASALLRTTQGDLLTVNDQVTAIYRMRFRDAANAIDLEPLPDCLTREQLAPFAAAKFQRYDLEGLAQDASGRIYISEEANRWILRWDPMAKSIERLAIDWAPVQKWFSGVDANASFEGVAVGGGFLYVANERQTGRILVVDLATLKVVDDFMVAPAGSESDDVHYSDLCWAEETLWVLMRDVRKLVQVDPKRKRVMAEFDFTAMERARANAYGTLFAPGFMEGLAVDDRHVWLLSDNNGMARTADKKDTRPTLFRCPRPGK